jgi:HSP20 family protein
LAGFLLEGIGTRSAFAVARKCRILVEITNRKESIMAITRYARRSPFISPWIEFEGMTNRLKRLFQEPSNAGGVRTPAWSPTVNVEESSEELLLTAELPGMGIEDIEIEVENNVLSLKGEKKEEDREESDDRRFHVWERRYGSFRRRFTLPQTVKTGEITAHVRDGILFVRMPKAQEAKSRKIDIKTEN